MDEVEGSDDDEMDDGLMVPLDSSDESGGENED